MPFFLSKGSNHENRITQSSKISDRKKARWTQAALARDVHGAPALVTSAKTCKWCSVGAVSATRSNLEIPRSEEHAATHALHEAAKKLSYRDAMQLNDLTNHALVMRMFDLAIESLES